MRVHASELRVVNEEALAWDIKLNTSNSRVARVYF